MAKTDRPRIDYMPGKAAFDALAIAGAMFPDMRPQAVLDKLVITGLCALKWKAPALYGQDRDSWKLPGELNARGVSITASAIETNVQHHPVPVRQAGNTKS